VKVKPAVLEAKDGKKHSRRENLKLIKEVTAGVFENESDEVKRQVTEKLESLVATEMAQMAVERKAAQEAEDAEENGIPGETLKRTPSEFQEYV
jgi:hypothetical protein